MFKLLSLICFSLYLPISLNFSHNEVIQEAPKTEWQLAKTWHYKKCRIIGIPYYAEKFERNDFLKLATENVYERVDDGNYSTGSWSYNQSDNSVQLEDSSTGRKVILYIEKITDNDFVYRIKEDWKFSVTVYMEVASVFDFDLSPTN